MSSLGWFVLGAITVFAFAGLLLLVLRSAIEDPIDTEMLRRRQRTYIKGAGVTILEPKDDHRIVGDVPRYPEGEIGRMLPRLPRDGRISDEPMGM